jgi:hypothetical protein
MTNRHLMSRYFALFQSVIIAAWQTSDGPNRCVRTRAKMRFAVLLGRRRSPINASLILFAKMAGLAAAVCRDFAAGVVISRFFPVSVRNA